MPSLEALHDLGQSVWLDYLSRELLNSGELMRLSTIGVRGVTANPTILDKAINAGSAYDAQIRRLALEGRTAREIYEAIVFDDIRRAADVLRPYYDLLDGADGFVSLEVSPLVADDTRATVEDVIYLFNQLDRPNVMIKVPATEEGIPAIRTLLSEGINVNITLIFSQAQYQAVVEAYLQALERRRSEGLDISRIASVASFFVSRIDTATDKALEAKGADDLLGTAGIASCKVAYEHFQRSFAGKRWEALAALGARVQRPLWASTSTKNPAFPDTIYVDHLIGPYTVNTMPEQTLHAFLDHGHVALTLSEDIDAAHARLACLNELGIDLHRITDHLTIDGVRLFTESYQHLMASLEEKRGRITAEGGREAA